MSIRPHASLLAAASAAFISLALALAPAASANTYSVSNTTDAAAVNPAVGCATASGFCTLRSAIQAANVAGGTNSISLAAGSYTLTLAPSGLDDDSTGDLNVVGGDTLTIAGAGSGSTTVDANFIDRAFDVADGGALTLSGLTVENGRPGGIGDISTCPAVLPLTANDGGAILAGGALTLTGDVISGNITAGNGGGIAFETLDSPTMSITDTTISRNLSCDNEEFGNDGGGIYESVNTGGTVTIDGSTIDGNTASPDNGFGGGLADEGQGGVSVSITGSTISNNTAQSGAGVYATGSEGADTVGFVGDTIDDNTAENPNVFTGGPNKTPDAIRSASSAAAASESALPADGGGIYVEGDAVTVINTTITGNTATDGGAIASGNGSTAISFSTITGNTATGSTLLGDSSSTGNLENEDSGAFTLDDTIVADGTSPSGAPTNCDNGVGGGFTSNGNNLFDDTADSGAECNAISSDLVKPFSSFDLGSLANNGGPTETEALKLGSPAIDASNESLCTSETNVGAGNATIDQRGIVRPQGPNCDIGAFEFQEADLAVSSSASPTTINVGQQTTVTDTIVNHGYSNDTGVSFTDPTSASFTVDSASASQGTCTHTPNTVSCSIGTMATFSTVTVTIDLTGKSAGSLTLDSAVTGILPDPNLGNNHAAVGVTVVAPPAKPKADLALVKKASPTRLKPDQRTTFTLSVANKGPNTDTHVVLTDKLPGGLRLDSVNPSRGKCSGDPSIRCGLGTMKSGAHATVKIVATATKMGRIRNTGHVTGVVHDPNLKNNSSQASVNVQCVENLTFSTNFMPADHVGEVKVYVDGHLTQTLHGSNLRTVKIKPVPDFGRHSVTVMFIISSLETVTATRMYKDCAAGRTKYVYPPLTGPGSS